MNSRWRGLSGPATLMSVAVGLSQGIVAVVYLLAARSATPEEFGVAATSVALGLTAAGLIDLGTNTYWVREGARGRMTAADTAGLLMAKVCLAVPILAGIASVAAIAVTPSFGAAAALVGVSAVISQGFSVGLRRLLRIPELAVTTILDRASALLLFLVLRALPVTLALGISLATGALVGAVASWVLTPACDKLIPLRPSLRNPWRGSGGYNLSSLAAAGQSLEVQVVAAVGGVAAAGAYTSVNRWTQPLGVLASAFSSAAMPFVARANSWREVWPSVRRALWLPGLSIGGAALTALLAPALVPFLLGTSYLDAAPVLQVLALGTIPGIANQVMAVLLQSRGHERAVAFASLGVVATQLPAVAAGAQLSGALGAAIASSGAQVVMGVLLAVTALRARAR